MRNVSRLVLAVFAAVACWSGVAHAAVVVCASTNPLELRTLTLNPGQSGGLCYTQSGNFNPAAAVSIVGTGTGLSASHLDKDNPGNPVSGDDAQESWLGLSVVAGGLQGGWTVDEAAWNTYQRLFVGFHFGNANGQGDAADPDSFIVELARSDNAGTWQLGGAGAALNGLSHIDLIGAGSCTAAPNVCRPQIAVPEPATLALAGLGLVGAIGMRRRRR